MGALSRPVIWDDIERFVCLTVLAYELDIPLMLKYGAARDGTYSYTNDDAYLDGHNVSIQVLLKRSSRLEIRVYDPVRDKRCGIAVQELTLQDMPTYINRSIRAIKDQLNDVVSNLEGV